MNNPSSPSRIVSNVNNNSDISLDDLMTVDNQHPSPSDPAFQNKIRLKREYYVNAIPKRPPLNDYQDIKEQRDNICAPKTKFELLPQQSFLSNFINPDTPYKGVLIFHGTGVGKCLTGNSLIQLHNNSFTIEHIWNMFHTSLLPDNHLDAHWSIPSRSLYVKSLDLNYAYPRIITAPVVRLFKQKINEYITILQLDNGNTVSLTNNHQLLTENGWSNNFLDNQFVSVYNNNASVNDDISLSKIISVDHVFHDGYVYDIEVPHYHNFIANNIICHNTCAGIAIAERFKPMIQKYNTKIYILVFGPIIKDNWRDELLKCTGETYLKREDTTIYISPAERIKAKKNAVNIAMQYYKFMSYRSFYRKVLGEKIKVIEKSDDNKIKVSYRKTKEGEFERDIAIDRIYNLDNCVIIVDEAHNLTGNAYGEALMKIIKNSKNLRIILLTATPMKNLADDLIELINFLRPIDDPILRDKIFNRHKNHLMDFKPGGIDYLKRMTQGYISYLRGADPLTFAKRIEKGIIPKGLLFTKIIQCKMLPFQLQIYKEALKDIDDTLDRRSEAVANFAFPGLSKDHKSIVGYYGREGINTLKSQLKTNYETLNKKIAKKFFDSNADTISDVIHPSENGKTISGNLLKFQYLKHFSIKFYKTLKKINRLVWGKKGARTAFIYSNLVKVGIEIFQEILLQNGYLEFDDNPNNYKINPDTICFFCGFTFKEHQQRKLLESVQMSRHSDISDSSTEYKKQTNVPYHPFSPATFIAITGKSAEDVHELIPEDKQHILRTYFSNINNKEGRHIKLVLGSKVMGEGISLANVAEVHILDVHFNLGRIDQIIGRAIRHCSHYAITNEQNKFPHVKVYKYAVTLDQGLSSEEELYKKAELKYLLVKKVERAIKQIAVDCPLNRHGNIFPEELVAFKNCIEPHLPLKKDQVQCPNLCDYTQCDYQCHDPTLNKFFWNSKTGSYDNIPKSKIDYSTFTHTLARNEIESVKSIIKELYRLKYVYTLREIVTYVKKSYSGEKRELFDDFFTFKALDELIPITENDFNNYQDTIFDKFNKSGYLIHINKYYIFQPFDQNEDVPMYYRSTFDKPMQNKLTLFNYLRHTEKFQNIRDRERKKEKTTSATPLLKYDFDSVMDYYDNRNEFKIVGIIDKESSRHKNKSFADLLDVFKIREHRSAILDKKRGTGIPSLKGAVCFSSKSKKYLLDICKLLDIKLDGHNTRTSICDKIKNKLLFLEKFSLGSAIMTYVMIPANHSKFPFPYNLHDRAKYIISQIKEQIKFPFNFKITQGKQTLGKHKNLPMFTITLPFSKQLSDFKSLFESLGGSLSKKVFSFVLK